MTDNDTFQSTLSLKEPHCKNNYHTRIIVYEYLNLWVIVLKKGYQQTLFDLMFEEEEKNYFWPYDKNFLDPIFSPELKKIS